MEYADYKKQELAQYRGNPMIEALPAIPGDEHEIVKNLTGMVNSCSLEEKQLKPFLRMHLLHRIRRDFFFPFAQVRRLDTAIHLMIRSAYMNRNPISQEYRSMLVTLDREEFPDLGDDICMNAVPEMGTVIFGMSGSGKSRALRQCLNYYPTIIRHTEYHGIPLTRTQLPWLMVEAPYDGNYVTFCRAVFQEIDSRCGTNNSDKYGFSTNSTSTMILHMQKLLLLYNVGILVIDEVQNLLNNKSGSEEMMAFFVSLTNQLNVPIIYCGTSNAIKLFQNRMSLARRQTGVGDMKFQTIERSSGEWESMVRYFWRGYVLQEETLLDDKMLDAFWEYSQGLIGIVVPLFCLVQVRALHSGKEAFDLQLLKKTYNEDLAMVKPMLEAVKSGNEWEMSKYDDIYIDLDKTINEGIKECQHMEELEEAIARKSLSISQRRQSMSNSIYTTIRGIGLCKDVEDKKLKMLIKQTVDSAPDDTEESELLQSILTVAIQPKGTKSNKQISIARKQGILFLFEQSEKNHTDIYNELLNYGFIKKMEDDFDDLMG